MKLQPLITNKLFTALLVLGLISCNVESEAPLPQTVKENLSTLESKPPILEDDYLVFENMDHVMAYSSSLQKFTEKERLNWESSMGFHSMLTSYNEFLDYSESSIETGYDMSMDEIRSKYADVLILKDDGDFFINTVFAPMANILNKRGIVKVGQALHKHMKDRVIVIQDGDINKLGMAARLEQSNENEGISINYVKDNSLSRLRCGNITQGGGSFPGATTMHFSNSWGFHSHGSSNDKYRLEVEVISFEWAWSSSQVASAITMKTQSRGIGGAWFAKKAFTVATVNNATLTSSQNLVEEINNEFRQLLDNDWSFYMYSTVGSYNPILAVIPQTGGDTWDELCYDLTFDTSFPHNSHDHSYTVTIN